MEFNCTTYVQDAHHDLLLILPAPEGEWRVEGSELGSEVITCSSVHSDAIALSTGTCT